MSEGLVTAGRRVRTLLEGGWLHPFMLSLFPVLAFYANNAAQIEFASIVRSGTVALSLPAVILSGALLLVRKSRQASLVTSLLLIGFWSYGHVYDGLKLVGMLGTTVVRHRYLLPLTMVSLSWIGWMMLDVNRVAKWTAVFNFVAAVLCVQAVVRVSAFQLERRANETTRTARAAECALSLVNSGSTPDVYLIIMDAYERDDVLWEMHGYDNTPFLRALEQRGFYIARGSLSNYRHTELTLASVLNFNYIQSILTDYSPNSSSTTGVGPLIAYPRIRNELECLGYYSVSIESGAYWSEWRDARYFFAREGGALQELQLAGGLTRSEVVLLNSTILRAAVDLASQQKQPIDLLSDPLLDHRDRVLFAFDKLQEIPNLPGRKLVFAHIISPHTPFVFGAYGEFANLATFETDPSLASDTSPLLKAYADQVTFLNSKLIHTVDAILDRSATTPVIIIQGDHGWAERDWEDKLSILNALHLPDDGSSRLHPRSTPVNTFRHVLNLYFDASLEILEDVSYYSDDDRPLDFTVVPNSWSPPD